MKHKTILINENTHELIQNEVRKIYLKHHPEMQEVYLSMNKLIFEAVKYYIKTEPEFKYMFEGEK